MYFFSSLKEQQANGCEKKPCFDISGTFYWCSPTGFEDALLVSLHSCHEKFTLCLQCPNLEIDFHRSIKVWKMAEAETISLS